MKIAIIENDKILAKKLWNELEKNWYEVEIFYTFASFKKDVFNCADLFIINLELWKYSGFDIVKFLREDNNCNSPIMVTSCNDDVEKKLKWFRLWVDDYICKPFSVRELIAKVWIIFRRFNFYKVVKIKYREFEFDMDSKELFLFWNKKELSRKELLLVELFLLNKGKIVTKQDLVKSVWWRKKVDNVWENTINVTLCKLKSKLWKEFNLETIIWVWYILK